MSHRAAKAIFFVGTITSLAIFLALTFDTHAQFEALTHADKLDEHVVAGKGVFEARNCNACHTLLGFGAYYAPDLTRAHARIGETGIRRRLAQPEAVLADSYRKMPRQNLGEQEIADMIAFLKWVDGIDNHDWPPQDSQSRWKRSAERMLASAALSPAAALIDQESCLACHSLGEEGSGSRLEWIGARRDAAYITRFLADPDAVSPATKMPKYDHLDEGQRQMIALFLTSIAADQER